VTIFVTDGAKRLTLSRQWFGDSGSIINPGEKNP
jgi:hypothetical protein